MNELKDNLKNREKLKRGNYGCYDKQKIRSKCNEWQEFLS